jgi:hypothetical protein
MIEKIPQVPRTNKLRIIQLLEADLNQVLCSVFAINTSRLAQETPGIVSNINMDTITSNMSHYGSKKWSSTMTQNNVMTALLFESLWQHYYTSVIPITQCGC